MSGPSTRRAVLPPAGRGPASRPPDTRPPAGPGRSNPPTSWDPVRFRAVGPEPSRAAAHEKRAVATAKRAAALEKRAAEARPIAGAPDAPLPDPADWAAAVARTAVEGLLGIRPVSQLARWVASPVYVALSRRAGLAVRVRGRQPATGVRVRSVTTCAVDEFVQEASVTLHDGTRFRAAAMRLERYHGRWLVTALEIG